MAKKRSSTAEDESEFAIDLGRYMSTTEAAQETGVSPRWIRKMIQQGVLEGRKVNPRAWLVSVNSLREFQRRRKV